MNQVSVRYIKESQYGVTPVDSVWQEVHGHVDMFKNSEEKVMISEQDVINYAKENNVNTDEYSMFITYKDTTIDELESGNCGCFFHKKDGDRYVDMFGASYCNDEDEYLSYDLSRTKDVFSVTIEKNGHVLKITTETLQELADLIRAIMD